MLFQILLVAHVTLTTLGYGGLIVIDSWLFVISNAHRPEALIQAIDVWRRLVRFFGPLTGLGVLLGFGVAAAAHVPFASQWLLGVYVAIIAALAAQAALMIPWQLRAGEILARGESVSTAPVAITIGVFLLAYVAILSLMLLR